MLNVVIPLSLVSIISYAVGVCANVTLLLKDLKARRKRITHLKILGTIATASFAS